MLHFLSVILRNCRQVNIIYVELRDIYCKERCEGKTVKRNMHRIARAGFIARNFS